MHRFFQQGKAVVSDAMKSSKQEAKEHSFTVFQLLTSENLQKQLRDVKRILYRGRIVTQNYTQSIQNVSLGLERELVEPSAAVGPKFSAEYNFFETEYFNSMTLMGACLIWTTTTRHFRKQTIRGDARGHMNHIQCGRESPCMGHKRVDGIPAKITLWILCLCRRSQTLRITSQHPCEYNFYVDIVG